MRNMCYIIGATLLEPRRIFFQKSPTTYALLTGNGKMENIGWRPSKNNKIMSSSTDQGYYQND
jgi:hypothetical protein